MADPMPYRIQRQRNVKAILGPLGHRTAPPRATVLCENAEFGSLHNDHKFNWDAKTAAGEEN